MRAEIIYQKNMLIAAVVDQRVSSSAMEKHVALRWKNVGKPDQHLTDSGVFLLRFFE